MPLERKNVVKTPDERILFMYGGKPELARSSECVVNIFRLGGVTCVRGHVWRHIEWELLTFTDQVFSRLIACAQRIAKTEAQRKPRPNT